MPGDDLEGWEGVQKGGGTCLGGEGGGRGLRREGARVYLQLTHIVVHCKAIILQLKTNHRGLPCWSSGEESAFQCRG